MHPSQTSRSHPQIRNPFAIHFALVLERDVRPHLHYCRIKSSSGWVHEHLTDENVRPWTKDRRSCQKSRRTGIAWDSHGLALEGSLALDGYAQAAVTLRR